MIGRAAIAASSQFYSQDKLARSTTYEPILKARPISLDLTPISTCVG